MINHKHPKIVIIARHPTWQNPQFIYMFHTNIDNHMHGMHMLHTRMMYIITSYLSELRINKKNMILLNWDQVIVNVSK